MEIQEAYDVSVQLTCMDKSWQLSRSDISPLSLFLLAR